MKSSGHLILFVYQVEFKRLKLLEKLIWQPVVLEIPKQLIQIR
jgi:hypothetical protein